MRASSSYACIFAYLSMMSLLISVKSQAATDVPGLEYFLPTKASNYDPKAPTPEQVLGFKIGEWHIHQHELTGYLEKLDAFSDRIAMREYARSPGRHPLVPPRHQMINRPRILDAQLSEHPAQWTAKPPLSKIVS